MANERLYDELAKWWPLISPPVDYEDEAQILRATFRSHLGAQRHSILDLGVGGGNLLSQLTCDFDGVGVDLAPEMLKHSQRLNPDVEHHVGDMRSIRLQRQFDAVLMHDAIAYLVTEADVSAALATAREHLKPGGILVLCPDWFRETFPDGFVSHKTERSGGTSVTYIEYVHDPDPTDSLVEIVMFILIRENRRLQIEQDRHTMGLFSRDQWRALVKAAGFDVHTRPYVKADYGAQLVLIVGTLPS